MRIIVLSICNLLLISFSTITMPVYADYAFSDAYSSEDDKGNVDDPDDTGDINDTNPETHFAARKIKVKNKGKKGPHSGHNIKPVVGQTEDNSPQVPIEVQQAPPAPPSIFPCDASVQCLIIDPMLPPDVCQNQCQAGWFCQGRMDMRIGHFNIAVCVPAQAGSMKPVGPMGPSQ